MNNHTAPNHGGGGGGTFDIMSPTFHIMGGGTFDIMSPTFHIVGGGGGRCPPCPLQGILPMMDCTEDSKIGIWERGAEQGKWACVWSASAFSCYGGGGGGRLGDRCIHSSPFEQWKFHIHVICAVESTEETEEKERSIEKSMLCRRVTSNKTLHSAWGLTVITRHAPRRELFSFLHADNGDKTLSSSPWID